jgi:hypothetical protein
MVCEYCQSTLLRSDVNLENLGKMAELLPDHSLLQIGSSGLYSGDGFSVIGRMQFQHSSGVWNSWHLLFDTGKTGWLSEASGTYTLSFEVLDGIPDLPLERCVPDLSVPIQGQRMSIIRIEEAQCIAGQGELSSAVPVGKTIHFVELAAAQHYASLEYQAGKAALYLGQAVALETLHLQNLRDIEQMAVRVTSRQLDCPSCGGSLPNRLERALTITCPHCATILDARNEKIAVLIKQKKKLEQLHHLTIPLGSTGRFEKADFTVIGYLQRSSTWEGVTYYWEEFLLHHPGYGFRWLVCSQGHWNLLKPLVAAPVLSKDYSQGTLATLEKHRYRHFAKYNAKIDLVAGEFYWLVKAGDKATLEDYIAPPYLLSKETQGKEIQWSQGEYLTPEQVNTAFGEHLQLMQPQGVFANQPCPYTQSVSAWVSNTLLFMLLAIVLHSWFVMQSREELVFSSTMQVNAVDSSDWSNYRTLNPETASLESEPFEIHTQHGNVVIEIDGALSNSWLFSSLTLVNLQNGLTYSSSREISDYSGYDGGEYWRENDSRAELIFSAVPAGRYQLQVETESERSYGMSSALKSQQIRVIANVPLWRNFWFLLAFLCIGPAIFYYHNSNFEQRRWALSDHPLNT